MSKAAGRGRKVLPVSQPFRQPVIHILRQKIFTSFAPPALLHHVSRLLPHVCSRPPFSPPLPLFLPSFLPLSVSPDPPHVHLSPSHVSAAEHFLRGTFACCRYTYEDPTLYVWKSFVSFQPPIRNIFLIFHAVCSSRGCSPLWRESINQQFSSSRTSFCRLFSTFCLISPRVEDASS